METGCLWEMYHGSKFFLPFISLWNQGTISLILLLYLWQNVRRIMQTLAHNEGIRGHRTWLVVEINTTHIVY